MSLPLNIFERIHARKLCSEHKEAFERLHTRKRLTLLFCTVCTQKPVISFVYLAIVTVNSKECKLHDYSNLLREDCELLKCKETLLLGEIKALASCYKEVLNCIGRKDPYSAVVAKWGKTFTTHFQAMEKHLQSFNQCFETSKKKRAGLTYMNELYQELVSKTGEHVMSERRHQLLVSMQQVCTNVMAAMSKPALSNVEIAYEKLLDPMMTFPDESGEKSLNQIRLEAITWSRDEVQMSHESFWPDLYRDMFKPGFGKESCSKKLMQALGYIRRELYCWAIPCVKQAVDAMNLRCGMIFCDVLDFFPGLT